MNFFAKMIFLVFALMLSHSAFAASCCGGTQGSSMAITGDEVSRFRYSQGVSFSRGRSIDFGSAVESHSASAFQAEHTGSLSVSHVVAERWQVSANGAWLTNSKGAWGIGDSTLGLTYVLRRNFLYSAWQPEIFLSVLAQVPTGTSFYEDRSRATGDALWRGGLSLLFSKSQLEWDWSLRFGYMSSSSRRFDLQNLNFTKGHDYRVELSIGHSPRMAPKWHLGLMQALEWTTPNAIQVNQDAAQRSLATLAFPTSLLLAYAFDETRSVSMSYVNRLWFPSQNAELTQALLLSLSYRRL